MLLTLPLALVLHPDKIKNPTPAQVREFEQVQMAYEVLSDPEGRKAVDVVLGAQVRTAQRVAAMSSQRRQMQEDLERREREASVKSELNQAHSVLRRHMDRIRAENVARMQKQAVPAKREREQQSVVDAMVEKKRGVASAFVPFSQRFATLDEFEAYAFKQLEGAKQ